MGAVRIESGLPAVQSEGRCAEHPERPVHGTCERCGRFVCLACARSGAGRRCRACVGQVMAAVPPSGGDARWAARLLYAHGFLSVIAVLPAAAAFTEMELALGSLQIVLYVTTGVFFLRWLYRAVRLTQALAAD